jgi:hypothetical protein
MGEELLVPGSPLLAHFSLLPLVKGDPLKVFNFGGLGANGTLSVASQDPEGLPEAFRYLPSLRFGRDWRIHPPLLL